MLKKVVLMVSLAMLPLASLQANSNLSEHPLANEPIFKHFQKMQEEMDRIFREFNEHTFKDLSINPTFSKAFSSKPNADLIDRGDIYELTMDLAGMDDKSIKIDVKDNYLSIEAKTEQKREQKEGDKIILQERHVGIVKRGMTLPKDAEAENYKSDYKNGVLTIIIPKKK